ncbi:alpha/beta fold hydrolase [Bacillus songklensis]|uniref:Alpha/beta fold hydrolase n=1 Tax=Bacillus songklensis TaxID=1069116 RepID=A0ABV8B3D4_9BACI
MSVVTLKTVQLKNGETIGYREREGGEHVVILVHGNMTSSKHWDLLLENMDESFRLYAVDMRGFGVSTYYTPVSSIRDFAEDLKLFADELQLKKFSLIGWSTGGAVSMQFVADYPGYCEKLVLLASASTRGYPFYSTNALGQPDVTKRLKTKEEVKRDTGKTIPVQTAYDTKNQAFLKQMWNMLVYRTNQPSEEKYREYLDDMLTQRNLADVYHCLNVFNISHINNEAAKGTGEVSKIDIPVLVLRGDHDLVVTDKMTKEILKDLGKRATYVELKHCGHSPLVDNLDLLTNHISEFLKHQEVTK